MGISVITGDIFGKHDLEGHPECNARLELALSGVPRYIKKMEPQRADERVIRKVHDPEYIQWLKDRCAETQKCQYLDRDTYITSASYEVAAYAVGGAINAVERTLKGEHCFAMVRPPGMHATRNRSSIADTSLGFCLLNNVAIAASQILTTGNRVAIIDWDVHHGNGTQQAFYDSNRVLYCSLHQDDIYPHTGWPDEIGVGEGKGYNLNAPLKKGATIADYELIFREVFVPAIQRMQPDAVLISAGQDMLYDDPLGEMEILPEDVGLLTAIIRDAAEKPLAFVLEGGYSTSHGTAINSIFRALEGRNEVDTREENSPREGTIQLARSLKKVTEMIRSV